MPPKIGSWIEGIAIRKWLARFSPEEAGLMLPSVSSCSGGMPGIGRVLPTLLFFIRLLSHGPTLVDNRLKRPSVHKTTLRFSIVYTESHRDLMEAPRYAPGARPRASRLCPAKLHPGSVRKNPTQ
ncbi:hypothetical protein MASSI9I_70455 [Massilia sp. 9I]|nr:hypothetical protein MASSI9I_70455 [Massilia sp. 9I]